MNQKALEILISNQNANVDVLNIKLPKIQSTRASDITSLYVPSALPISRQERIKKSENTDPVIYMSKNETPKARVAPLAPIIEKYNNQNQQPLGPARDLINISNIAALDIINEVASRVSPIR